MGGKLMNRTVDALIVPYARRRTLELVLSLSGYEADKDAYLEAKGILERAIAALDDGRDPADNIERIDGQLVEL
jgi:hypothetical protein